MDDIPFKERARFRLNKIAFGVAAGAGFGVCLMLATWMLWLFSGGILSGVGILGWSASFAGGFMGLFWGALVGFVGGFTAAVAYNETNRLLETKAARRSKTWAQKIDDAIEPDFEIDAEFKKHEV